MTIAGLYLAAGQSSRMGRPKLSLELSPGMALGEASLSKLIGIGLDPIVAVVRSDDPLLWLSESCKSTGSLRIERCEEAYKGMSYSIRQGMKALEALKPDAVFVALADQPLVKAESLLQLKEAWNEAQKRGSSPDFAASVVHGVPMPPVIFSKSMFPALLELEGDQGARALFKQPEWEGIYVPFSSEVEMMDVDTPEDFQAAAAYYGARYRFTP